MVGKPFAKGQSGNPGGRPKDGVLRDLCRAETEDNVKFLIATRENKKAPIAARVQAVSIMLDRGWGKAPQAITGPNGGPLEIYDAVALSKLSKDEIEQLIALRNKLAAVVGSGSGAEAEGAGD